MRVVLAIVAILLSFPAVAQLNDNNSKPYMTFKIFVNGLEVPVTRTGEGTYCDGGGCDFTVSNINFGRTVTIKFIPQVKAGELGIKNFNELGTAIPSFSVEGATLQNYANTSPDNWLGRPPDDPFDPGDRAGVEWTADLIPTRVAGEDFVDVTVTSLGSGWQTWTSETPSYRNKLTFRMEPATVPVIPPYGLWFLAALLSLIGLRKLKAE